ncbi:ATP-dependent 6-phosphofructokinase [Flagellimonas halotolerans]|uniref:ATP-dependent 6-phosphofructokinase n=1 Tax=Flagellimonas halotolerans TaxID=3112164 RepID=A0ABU6IM86_9FLAO|nr:MULTISPECIES: ATP-dependent 6-phosphofructokinase [unclassified Allomuricauda]MEC3964353.1 ATP-dependent 6-phosphofructokinase [Muricauda sp. SYSU M86414]MEC4264223.1 ATP-dependent 6-phosphofructokinase [Muricauda sp. SYSU M84420]
MNDNNRFDIESLGAPQYSSPLELSTVKGDRIFNFVSESDRLVFDPSVQYYNQCLNDGESPICMEKAGPRQNIFFDAKTTTAAIVTCGGLCPGINNVIRGLVMALHYFYGIKKIIGIPYGYEGLNPEKGHGFVELTPDKVKDIHQFGGTFLGSSRGGQDVSVMVDTLEKNHVDMLFAIGGDGTLKGVNAIGGEIAKRNGKISVVGIPKTIDNDIDLIDESFGFQTAFDVASPILRDAHNEATGAYNGISIIKLMGRDSGFIAASAALAMPVVNFVLVPEMDFSLEGEEGFLKVLEKRLQEKKHAVIVVAEGAGQQLFKDRKMVKDASGNVQHEDIGVFLKEKITAYFKGKSPVTIKYIDPSYIVRCAPANSSDSVYCSGLAYHAVHGAMAGKTKFVASRINNRYVYLPVAEVTKKRKKIDLEGEFWFSVLQSTGQPFFLG